MSARWSDRRACQEHLPPWFLRALAVASTHYIMDLKRVSSGYVVPTDASPDTASVIMNDTDATVEEFATVLAGKLEADIPP